jgi:hypothetical protein
MLFMMLLGAGAAGYLSLTADELMPAEESGTTLATAVERMPAAVELVGGPGYAPPPATNLPAHTVAVGTPPKPSTLLPDEGAPFVPTPSPAVEPEPAPATNTAPPPEGRAEDADAAAARREQIQSEIRGQMPAFRECYDLILELEPDLDDRLALVLEIEATGEQDSTTTLTSIEAGRMELEHLECFAEIAAELDMPPPEDGTGSYTIRYPIILHHK